MTLDDQPNDRSPHADSRQAKDEVRRTESEVAEARRATEAKPAALPNPQAVVQDPALSHEEKIEKLRRWSHDAREIETANDEGMRGVVTPSNLPAVQKALRELGAAENPADEPPAKNSAADGS